MKTHTELLAEARRVEAMGELYAQEHRQASSVGRVLPSRVIPTFLATSGPRERWIEAEIVDGAIEYRLLERDEGAASSTSRTLCASDSAFDVLAEGDELEEKEALSEKLAPLVERIACDEADGSIDPSAVAEIEAILDAGELDPAAQIRTKAEIVELLGGELEPSRFVDAIVGRRIRRESLHESIAERLEQRLIQEL